jgi:ATP-dependent protease HslVU (ClpYQ) peptidase subunit
VTTIIAVQHKDKVVIGADSQITGGGGRRQSHREMVKISERSLYLIAGSGECAPCDLAQHIWQPPIPKASDVKDLYHFMIAKVVPSLKACFKENEYKWNEADGDGETKFAFLIALGGQIFEIADDMSVSLDSRGFYGVGSGSDYASGALSAGATIEKALAIAAENDIYTSAPFIYQTQARKRLVKTSVKN